MGTIPLILAFVAIIARPAGRSTMPWRLLIPVSFAMATMPRWWPQGYLYLLAVPGLGYFRVPARYTLLTSLGAAILAGEGFDRSISRTRFRLGLAAALTFGGCAAAAAAAWSMRGDVHLRSAFGGIPDGFLWALLAWSIALAVVLAWRAGKIGCWAPLGRRRGRAGASSTTRGRPNGAGRSRSPRRARCWPSWPAGNPSAWSAASSTTCRSGRGWRPRSPTSVSRTRIRTRSSSRSRSGCSDPDRRPAPDSVEAAMLERWLRRCRVTHVVDYRRAAAAVGEELGRWRDPALDRIVYHAAGEPASRSWSIVRVDDPFPEARVAARAGRRPTAPRSSIGCRGRTIATSPGSWPRTGSPAVPTRERARLTSWDGTTAAVEHDGPCDLVIARTFDPGWLARVDDGPERPVLPVRRRIPGGAPRRRGHPSRQPALSHPPDRPLECDLDRRGEPGDRGRGDPLRPEPSPPTRK